MKMQHRGWEALRQGRPLERRRRRLARWLARWLRRVVALLRRVHLTRTS